MSVEAKSGGHVCSLSVSSSPDPIPVFVSMYEIESFAYMFYLETGLESSIYSPVSWVYEVGVISVCACVSMWGWA